jgi:hypothetical protein
MSQTKPIEFRIRINRRPNMLELGEITVSELIISFSREDCGGAGFV